MFVAKIGGCPKKSLEEAGIDPVDRFAFEYIEESALAYFADYAAQLSSGSIVEKIGADAVIRQGAYTAKRA